MTITKPGHIETRLFINNEFVPSVSGKTFELFNPTTEEKTVDVSEAQEEDVEIAVEAAKKAFETWKETSAGERAALLLKLADALRAIADENGYLDAITMGRPANQGGFTIQWLAVPILRQFAGLAGQVHGETSIVDGDGMTSMTFRQPFGVCAGIIPWNAPLGMTILKAAPAVAAGNVIIIKTSEKSPLSPLIIARLVKEVGFPPGVIQILHGPGKTGAMLASHMEIRKISFTGSVRTGKIVSELAARSNLKNVTLELGGKSPTVVPKVAYGFVLLTGQACVSANRVYVHESIAEEFTQKLKAHIEQIYAPGTGDPMEQAILGPLVDKIQYEHVMKFIEEGKKAGSEVVTGGSRLGDKGYFVQPTIFRNAAEDAYIMQVESFGPIGEVNSFKTDEEALKRANDSEYGLYASVFTNDLTRALKFAKGFEDGAVCINGSAPMVSMSLPFGGWKQSGIGYEVGIEGFKSWTQIKSIVICPL